MTTLLRVDASIRVDGSVSRALADSAEAAWRAEHPDGVVVRRDLGKHPVPAGVWQTLITDRFGWEAPGDAEFADLAAANAVAEEILTEFKAADAVLLAVPLYNYGIAQHVKGWMDVLLTDQGLQRGGDVAGRPLILTLARGGGYGPGTPREGWDHATPYLERIFGEVFQMDVHKAEAELTLAPVTPGMEELIEAAKESEKAALDHAGRHGTQVARRLTGAAA
ncbi:FMN-dependent NADH-azoreductase [Kribbella amoyensis]|uniref:FMN dependent NADH:quinone oxidoreductase n=1 Tax=Kribbella amoyensis TaxID=996641 RepID=A0A561BXY5_9ACTN|nr:NAD(P)H-dependent oxidoreductase [Kribbella amoyensis]TWD83750.1 FMN-dependent NADH-azoreductase [Kribbella amoyensis]